MLFFQQNNTQKTGQITGQARRTTAVENFRKPEISGVAGAAGSSGPPRQRGRFLPSPGQTQCVRRENDRDREYHGHSGHNGKPINRTEDPPAECGGIRTGNVQNKEVISKVFNSAGWKKAAEGSS